MSVKITERDILNSMLDGSITPEVMEEYARKRLGQLDKRNESAKKRAAKKRAEGDVLTEAVLSFVSDTPQSREDIFNAMIESGEYDEESLTIGKVGYRLSALARETDGRISKAKATIGGTDGGRAREVIVYMLAE